MERVCPLLGLQLDRRTAIDGIDSGHRCYAEETPIPLDRQQQARLCLTADHERCERYLAHVNRNGGLRPAHGGIVEGLVSTRLILAPDPAWRGIAGRARRASVGPLLAIGAGGVALAIGGVAVASGAMGEVFTGAGGTPSPSASVRPSESAAASSSASASASAVATASPTSSPGPSPTPAPTPVPTAPPPPPPPQETYVVQEGDTLASIAQRFGTTASAIQAASGIDDPDEIVVGQLLAIP
ncbi:MAG: LysM domain-containing protein [Candidatus Limnocylindria bacterium]